MSNEERGHYIINSLSVLGDGRVRANLLVRGESRTALAFNYSPEDTIFQALEEIRKGSKLVLAGDDNTDVFLDVTQGRDPESGTRKIMAVAVVRE